MLRPATTVLLLGIGGVVSGVAAVRAFVSKTLLARGCTEDMGYRLDVDGTTMTSAGCALDRAGQVVVVPGLSFWPVALALLAALTCVVLAGIALPGARGDRKWWVAVPVAAGATFGLGLAGLAWWRSHTDQVVFCRDRLGGTTTAWAYCRVGEHGAVPMQPTWPSIAVLISALLVIAATGIWTLWRKPSTRDPRSLAGSALGHTPNSLGRVPRR